MQSKSFTLDECPGLPLTDEEGVTQPNPLVLMRLVQNRATICIDPLGVALWDLELCIKEKRNMNFGQDYSFFSFEGSKILINFYDGHTSVSVILATDISVDELGELHRFCVARREVISSFWNKYCFLQEIGWLDSE